MFQIKQMFMKMPRIAGLLAAAWMLASAAAVAETMTAYVYDKILTLPTTATTSGIRGLHFANGLLYAVQNGSKKIQVVNPDSGAVLRSISHANALVDVFVDADGSVWAVDDVGTGTKMWSAAPTATSLSAAFSLPTGRAYGVARDAAGNLYVCDPDGPIAKYGGTGELLDSVAGYGSYGIALSPDGSNVYIGGDANSTHMLLKSICTIDFDTELPTVVASYILEAGVTSIDVDAGGNIFAAVRNREAIYLGENGVFNYDATGNLLHRWNAWDPETGLVKYDLNCDVTSGLGVIYGLAVDSDSGTVYVSQNDVKGGDSHVLVFKTATFLPGDANRDGRVDAADAAVLAENWRMPQNSSWQHGDFNQDGSVDDTDATLLAANWMKTIGSTTAVPEPGLFALSAAGLLCLPVIRYRKQRLQRRPGNEYIVKMVKPLLCAALAVFILLSSARTLTAAGPYIFASFRGENTADGLHLAYSFDGYEWTSLHNDQSFMTPTCGNDTLRDPEIILGPDGVFRMAWTCAKHGFGYATSTDLMNWSTQRTIPVSVKIPGAQNTWAPDIFYDDVRGRYQIVWATDTGSGFKHYYTTTADFDAFADPQILFNPGHSSIDATMLKTDSGYTLVYKDERDGYKRIKIAHGVEPLGPFTGIATLPTPQNYVEGPTAIKIGSNYFIYYDHYVSPQYQGALRSSDLVNWEDVTDQVLFHSDTRHGCVFEVSQSVLKNIIEPDPSAISYKYEKTLTLPTSATSSGIRGLHWSNGLLYATQNGGKQIQVVDPDSGAVLRTISHSNYLVDVAADFAGNVWAVDDVGSGAKLWYADGDDTTLKAAFTLTTGRAYGLARDSEGNFYVSDPDGPIAKYDSTGALLQSAPGCGSYALALSSDGTAVYAGGGIDPESPLMPLRSICAVDIAADSASMLASFAEDRDFVVTSIDVDDCGNIFAAMRNRDSAHLAHNAVVKLDSLGNLLNIWNAWNPESREVYYDENSDGTNGLGVIYGIAVDKVEGTIYVSQNDVVDGDSHILVFQGETASAGETTAFTELDAAAADSANQVPEPGIFSLAAAGSLALFVFLHRKRRA